MHHVDAFYDAIAEVQPTVFFGTPAVYESLYYRLKELRRTMSGLQRMFLNWDVIPAELFAPICNPIRLCIRLKNNPKPKSILVRTRKLGAP